VEPGSHNRFYLSPYYPVFGSRMVMIGHPGRQECVRNGLFTSRSAIFTGASRARPVDRPAGREHLGTPLFGGLGSLSSLNHRQ
jgi:hypothetical protein